MLKWKQDGQCVTVYLSGEIDHCASEALRNNIESLIHRSKCLELRMDFSKVTFMDSSAIGMLIGRYKTMIALGGKICAQGLSPAIQKLYRMAGLHRIIPIICEERRKEA